MKLLAIFTLVIVMASCSKPSHLSSIANKIGNKNGFLSLMTDSFEKYSLEKKLDSTLQDLLIQFLTGANINNFFPSSTQCMTDAQQMVGQLISQTTNFYQFFSIQNYLNLL